MTRGHYRYGGVEGDLGESLAPKRIRGGIAASVARWSAIFTCVIRPHAVGCRWVSRVGGVRRRLEFGLETASANS